MANTKVAILDYGVGNLFSVANALKTAGADVIITSNPADIDKADKVMLPGVGAIGDAMYHLCQAKMDRAVQKALATKPVMAICVGMQMMFENSAESFGGSERVMCLGVIKGTVERFEDSWLQGDKPIKIPHVGWNMVDAPDHSLWTECQNDYFYFTHSYYCKPGEDVNKEGILIATCDYGQRFCASIIKDNLFATQFHPEKSHKAGLRLLANFINWQI